MPFDLRSEPRVLLLESVAWTKLYKRSFLQEHALQFEDGMNSYEDICFHFSVLMKATRISLLDEALSFTDRTGQVRFRRGQVGKSSKSSMSFARSMRTWSPGMPPTISGPCWSRSSYDNLAGYLEIESRPTISGNSWQRLHSNFR